MYDLRDWSLFIVGGRGRGSEDYDLPRTTLGSVVFWWFPFVSCKFCTALPLYSVSDNRSSPQSPLENHVIPKILWLPSSPPPTPLGDKSWLFPCCSLFIKPHAHIHEILRKYFLVYPNRAYIFNWNHFNSNFLLAIMSRFKILVKYHFII